MTHPRHRSRDYDLVIFGATGFTGGLTADYLARHAPSGMRWAIAGRDPSRLRRVAQRLAELSPSGHPVGTIRADSQDAGALRSLAESSRVVASTVGPFMTHGSALVVACVQAGADYLDITGEPEFVDRIWLDHHDTATRTGARLVHACGFDSVPHDLGVWFTLHHLPVDQALSIAGYVRAHATFSAGTYHSALRAFGRARQGSEVARRRREREGRSGERRVGSLPSRPHRLPGTPLPRPATRLASPGRTHRWAVPLPTIDPIVISRSARALARYGPDFRYGHFADVGGLPMVGVLVQSAVRQHRRRRSEDPDADRGRRR